MHQLHGSAIRISAQFWQQRPTGAVSTTVIYWLIFALSIAAFLLDYLIGDFVPVFGTALQIAGLVTCGFAWLFSRALFRPGHATERWPKLIVAGLFLSSLVLYLSPSRSDHGVLGYVSQLQELIGSAVLVLIVVEALDVRERVPQERLFRWSFAGSNIALVGTSYLFALPGLVQHQDHVNSGLAAIALVGATAALRYRLNHPLDLVDKTPTKTVTKSRANPAMAKSLSCLLENKQVYLNSELKVADLAEMLEEPEYKVSQCIVNDLKFDNFNQLVNSYRIDEVKRQLVQPNLKHLPVLTIALDCGFASLGPFNRAFKANTGITPTEFRRSVQTR